jgi:hypothetical protein
MESRTLNSKEGSFQLMAGHRYLQVTEQFERSRFTAERTSPISCLMPKMAVVFFRVGVGHYFFHQKLTLSLLGRHEAIQIYWLLQCFIADFLHRLLAGISARFPCWA